MLEKYLDFDLALSQSLQTAVALNLKEIIGLDKALTRVLSSDIVCVKNLPSFNNSAMDGFAIKAVDAGKELDVVKTIFAGENHEASLVKNQCYKIMTGAKVPSDVDTIIPIENVESYENDKVKINLDVKEGSNFRKKGEEKAVGSILFSKGQEINSSIVAVLASQGITMLEVYKKLSVAVLSTGDELKEPWQNAQEDEIYNCNSYGLISLLNEKGFDSTYIGVVPDNLEKSVKFINELKKYDVIITTGGISMGDADFVGEAFKQNNLKTIFHGVNIKPGKPIMMGKMDDSFVICLPGNPLTAMVNMHLFVIPVLRKIQGHENFYHNVEIAKNTKEFKTKKGRANIVLGTCEKGGFEVTQENKYGSGMTTVLCQSNSIVVTNNERSLTKEECSIKVISFNCSYTNKIVDLTN
ncbi:MAG: molybdopterin molybdotransferase [Sulfurimonas sp.]|jgi:molybdopterin molybdotransferase